MYIEKIPGEMISTLFLVISWVIDNSAYGSFVWLTDFIILTFANVACCIEWLLIIFQVLADTLPARVTDLILAASFGKKNAATLNDGYNEIS